jgi:ribosomal-protein-alanine N-acetyltransferase
MSVRIETQRFTLRELTPDDASERYLSWLTDGQAQKYIIAAATTRGIDDLRQYIGNRVGRNDVLFLGIFDKINGLHIGNIKYEPIDLTRRCATMGILIGDIDYRGKGVTAEVLAVSARWLQREQSIDRILLGVSADNLPAIRAYEKVGFVIEDSPYLRKSVANSLCMVWQV